MVYYYQKDILFVLLRTIFTKQNFYSIINIILFLVNYYQKKNILLLWHLLSQKPHNSFLVNYYQKRFLRTNLTSNRISIFAMTETVQFIFGKLLPKTIFYVQISRQTGYQFLLCQKLNNLFLVNYYQKQFSTYKSDFKQNINFYYNRN